MSKFLAFRLLLATLVLSSVSTQASVQSQDPPPPFQEGDVFVGVGSGLVKRFRPDGTLLQTLDTTSGSEYQTGMCFDSVGSLYTTNFDSETMSKFDNTGSLSIHPWGGPFGKLPESCVLDADGNVYTGEVDGGELIRKWNPDGDLLATYDAATEDRGIDWLDLSDDQCTMYYTSEGSSIKRYDVCNDTQLTDFVTGLARPCFSLRLRPNGEVMVACEPKIYRLSGQGTVLQTYDPGDGSEYWFAMNLDPDGTSFWTGGYNSGQVYRIDIDSGNELVSFDVGIVGPALAGISVVGEIGATLVDSDEDGLFDVWEEQGIDSDGDSNIDVDLPAMGADPNKKDIFVEVDWMSDNDHSHKPKPAAIEEIVNSFANSSVDGAGINLHVDVGPDSIDYVTGKPWGDLSGGNSIAHADVLLQDQTGDDLNALIDENFDDARSQVFHYSIFAHQYARNGIATCSSGVSFGNDYQVFLVTLGCFDRDVGSVNEQAGTFMHELGHNLGLGHGGGDEVNYKPNYLSIMNYSFQMGGLIIDGADEHYDYSRFDLPDLDESQLSEPNGLNGGSQIDNYGTKFHITFPWLCIPEGLGNLAFTVAATANGPVNWDCNIGIDQDPVQEDANNDGRISTLSSHNDWTNLDYTAGGIGSAGAPPSIQITQDVLEQIPEELTPEQDELIQRVVPTVLYLPITVKSYSQATPVNSPPHVPSTPWPPNDATAQDLTVDLSWTGGDPDGDAVTYDVYLEANDSSPDSLVCDDTPITSCDPGTLSYNTHYYWQVVARDEHGATTTGPVWEFTTVSVANNPPHTPSSPAPSDGATGQSVNVSLGWGGGDPDGDAVTYDVYLEANDSTPDNLACNDTSSTSCDPGTLSYDTHYYWKAVARDEHGATAMGAVWEFTTESDGPANNMVFAPAGEFTMGSASGYADEQPVHTVYLDAYSIDKYEVTNAQFAAFLNARGNQKEGGVTWLDSGDKDVRVHQTGGTWQADAGYGDHPVVEVSWYGARAYCGWAGKRLPTEAEWEKAARGTDGRTYPWGNQAPDCSRLNSWNGYDCVGDTSPVGGYPTGASPYGALDMAGNVWEWVNDWYQSDYYASSPHSNPPGPNSGDEKLLRGGSWYSREMNIRTANRYVMQPEDSGYNAGFRCAVSQ